VLTEGLDAPAPRPDCTAVLVVDVRPGSPEPLLGHGPRRLVQDARELPDAGDPPAAARVAGVYDAGAGDGDWLTRLAAWSYAAGVPVVAIGIGPAGATIGPVTAPGLVGCGHCARQRMLAAAAGGTLRSRGAPADDAPSPEVLDAVREILATQLDLLATCAAAASALAGHVMQVDGQSGEITRHRVLALSRCAICGGAAAEAARCATAEGDAHEAPGPGADGLAGWVDPLTGVIPALMLDPAVVAGTATPVVITAAAPHVVDDDGTLRQTPAGWGKGLTVADAVRSAVGETVERYCATLPDPARVVWARQDELDGEVLAPSRFRFYDEEQYDRAGFPFARFDAAAIHPWTRGRWLAGGSPVWVPAVLTYLSLTIGPENLICQGTSNGLAASTGFDDAALRATLELVERDAFMTAWLTGTPATPVVLDELGDGLRAVVEQLAGEGGRIETYVLPAACGTAALCLAIGDGERTPGVSIGLGADLDPQLAMRQAILELGQTRPYLSAMLRAGVRAIPEEPGAVREMLDHAAFFFPARRAVAFDRLRAGRGAGIALGSLGHGDSPRSLPACASALEAAGVRVAVVDVTSPDAAAAGFRVARAVSPQLQTISYGHGFDRAPVDRIRDGVLVGRRPPIHPIW
jgi:ribosomal protein S12 methylthiotransferase accessory factor